MGIDAASAEEVALRALGLDAGTEAAAREEQALASLGRVTSIAHGFATVRGGFGDVLATVAGRVRGQSSAMEQPAVGDWVSVDVTAGSATVRRVWPRRTELKRRAAGTEGREQVVCANVDVAFIVAALGAPVNRRRLERFVVIAHEGGVRPVIVLSKADLEPDVAAVRADVERWFPGLSVLALSARGGEGVEALVGALGRGETGVLLGVSGAGKTTLLNRVVASALRETREVRDDGKGRHTTTARELFVLEHGAMLIDTPGLREVGVGHAGDGLAQTFDDVARVSERCRFRDCTHAHEPGCAVRDAIALGELDAERVRSWVQLRAEAAAMDSAPGRGERSQRRDARVQTRALRSRLRDKGRK